MRANSLHFLILIASAAVSSAEELTNVVVTTEATPEELKEEVPSNDYLSEKYFQKAYRYIRNSAAFKRLTKQELLHLLNELETWEEPEHFAKHFPYYLAGYDSASRPVWVAEVGKYNIRAEVERGPKNIEIGMKYIFLAVHRFIKSLYDQDTPDREIRHGVFIVDFDGFDLQQYSHPETLAQLVRVFREYKEVIDELVGKSIFINVSPMARAGVDMFRPILGRVMERIEVYDTSKDKWGARIKAALPIEAIPPWYGGNKYFRPLQIYG